MRALTVKQPWASLIASGIKQVENRTYKPPTTMLGGKRFAIHAGKGFDADWHRSYPCSCGGHAAVLPDLCEVQNVICLACRYALEHLSNGKARETLEVSGRILCTARIVATLSVEMGMEITTLNAYDQIGKEPYDTRFWQRDCYGWVLADVELVDDPRIHRGMLGFWEVKP